MQRRSNTGENARVRSCRGIEVMRRLLHECHRGSETIRRSERSKRDDAFFGKQLGGQVYHKESNRECASSMRICTRRWYEVVAMSTLTGVRSAELYVCRAPQIGIVVRIDQLKRAEVLKVTLDQRAAQKYLGYEKTTKTGIDKKAQLRQRRKENGKKMNYWKQYTKRPDVIAARKRRNEAFHVKHKVAYNARRAEQKRAQRRAAGIAPRSYRQKLNVKKKPACHQH